MIISNSGVIGLPLDVINCTLVLIQKPIFLGFRELANCVVMLNDLSLVLPLLISVIHLSYLFFFDF